MNAIVYGNSPFFTSFLFSYGEVLSRLQVSDLPHGNSGQVGGSEIRVDTQGKDAEVTWAVGEELLDGADVFFGADGVYSGAVTPFGVVGVAAHNSPPCNVKLLKYNN